MSLKGDKYETLEEVKFRLENTIVLYEGDPVYINRVVPPEEAADRKEISRVYFHPLPLRPGGKEVRKFLSSRNFELAPFRMGYMNHQGEATYVSRAPVRQNRQGLSQGTTGFFTTGGAKARMDFHTVIESQGFVDMVKGSYPDFKTALAMLEDKEGGSVAISRSFAFLIDHDLEALMLHHKHSKCGLAFKNDKALKVPPKFHFLREEMEECRIPLA